MSATTLITASAVLRPANASRMRRRRKPQLKRAAPGRLDLRRRRRAADPPRPRTIRRGRSRPDRPRASLHRRANAQRLHLPGMPPRIVADRSQPPRHGATPAPQGKRQHLDAPATGTRNRPGPQDVRDARRRQRIGHVRHRRPHAGWNDDQLRALRALRARDFEVVDSTLLPRPAGG
jgi:hypothetical protein